MTVTSAVRAGNAVPHWIWVENQEIEEPVSFTRVFEIDKSLKQASLFVASDFCAMRVLLNGTETTKVEAYGESTRIDVSPALRIGVNYLEVRASPCPGPSAIATRLQIQFGDGSESHIVTDGSWNVGSTNGRTAVDLGSVAEKPWLIAADGIRINAFDDYTQWKRALNVSEGTSPGAFQALPGFELERLRSAEPGEGSWVSMAIDAEGRIVIGREGQGILRMTVSEESGEIGEVETINTDLEECRGLLFAYGSLYVNANNSKGLYRLRDTDADDLYDEVQLLRHFPGNVGHGRNDLALGTDGFIYGIHGDSVDVPTDFVDRTSPFRENRRGEKSAEGYLIRTDRDGKTWELLSAGLRNPFGIDFNTDGEPFTYDADAEFDMGAPWYRPTRVNHLVSGSDFGWRGVTGNWPPYFPDHPDNAQPSLDIGKGSPTSVKFGYRSNFPRAYQRALFILDWAYGRILAVHMAPRGASYCCRAEMFLRGRPLNVTDLDFGPDGAMYFVTGGRKTQSALYRVRYVGPKMEDPAPTHQQQARDVYSEHARAQRYDLEVFHRQVGIAAVEHVWPHLGSVDPSIRHAARIAVEHQPIDLWREWALAERRPVAALTAMMALARSGLSPARAKILTRLNSLPLGELPPSGRWSALYMYKMCLAEMESLDTVLLERTAERIESLVANDSSGVQQLRRELLVTLGVPSVVPEMVTELSSMTDQRSHLYGLFVLRSARHGWNPDRRRDYFRAIRHTDNYLGGSGLPGFLDNIRTDAVATLTEKERKGLSDLIEVPNLEAENAALPQRPFVKEWKLGDLIESLDAIDASRDFELGERMYFAALCDRCHRLGSIGKPLGPDLTSVSRRFSRRDILASILEPSQVIAVNYRSHQVMTNDGRQLEGRIVHTGDYREAVLKIAMDPRAPGRLTEIVKSEIESISLSSVSFMPKGLLNTLTKQEILDLLAFIEAAGDAERQ